MSEGIPKSQSREEIESSAQMTFEEAEQLFQEDFLGPREVEQVFGARSETVPNIPFSKEELERAKELGQQLIYQTETMDAKDPETGAIERDVPITLSNLKKYFPTEHADIYNVFENFCTKEKPRGGWRLTSKDLIPDSTFKNYLEQTDLLIEYLQNEVFKGTKLQKQYEDAIVEFKQKKDEMARLMDSDLQGASQALIDDLKITKLVRELSVETRYRSILNNLVREDKLLPSTYTWTASRASYGDGTVPVYAGGFASGGCEAGGPPDFRGDQLGVSFSRGS